MIKKKLKSSEWGHKIFQIHNTSEDVPPFDPFGDRKVEHMQLDDVADEMEYLHYNGWRYQMGFSTDDKSFYLFYKKPINSR